MQQHVRSQTLSKLQDSTCSSTLTNLLQATKFTPLKMIRQTSTLVTQAREQNELSKRERSTEKKNRSKGGITITQ